MSGTAVSIAQQAASARIAAHGWARTTAAQRDGALRAIAQALREHALAIETANAEDLREGAVAGLDTAMLDRLRLDVPRLHALSADVEHLAAAPDPLASTFDGRTLDNGLRLHKRRVPIGVIGIVYEARPNVTIDALALTLKTGNGVVLRGGKESLRSNRLLVQVARAAIADCGLDPDIVQFVDRSARDAVLELLHCGALIDLVIPRGGAGLHALCRAEARMPVITGGIGICHLYLSASADLARALPLILNAKTQRPTVCNALDTVLIDRAIAAQALPLLLPALLAAGVQCRLDPATLALTPDGLRPQVQPAGAQDFDTEWLGLVLGMAVVEGLDAAIDHIRRHSSGHSDGILSADPDQAHQFLERVDSAAVYWNASTRFTDGGQFGLGAEVAVSTQRIHARGPMGLEALTSYKWVVQGDYHVRP